MSLIDEIKKSVDIVNIVQEYIPLSKKGKNYWGICPFHNDSNPSMSISPEKQMFNCFSCGESGGVFKFVQNIEKISFKEALKKVGNTVGINVKINTKISTYSEKQKEIISVLKNAMDYYRLFIETDEAKEALKYAEKRGLNLKIRERFNIGYAANNRLSPFLKKVKEYDESILINASLVNSLGNDFFKNRLIFGISNEFNDIVGFSGRTLDNDDSKYINSAETMVFEKNKILYNWNNAKEIANKKQELIIVEGFMDVIALYKAGFENVVAIMGTSLSESNINKIKSLNIVLMLDSDKAGLFATIKFIKILLKHKIKTFVVQNNFGKDPDELFMTEGKEKIEDIINKKISSIQFIYNIHEKQYSKDDSLQVESFIKSFKKYLNYATVIEKEFFINKIEKEFGISRDFILEKKIEYKPIYKSSKSKIIPNYNKHSYTMIRTLLKSRPLLEYYISLNKTPFFIDKNLFPIDSRIKKSYKENKNYLLEYDAYIKDIIKLEGDTLKTKKELDEIINYINQISKRYKKSKIRLKLNNKGGNNG